MDKMSNELSETAAGQSNPAPRWLVILCLVILFSGLLFHDLWTPDEPREAAIAMEMIRTGEIIIPHLAGEPFVEKPPLYYIASAAMLRITAGFMGPIIALRLTSALWGLATLGVVFLLARRMYGAVPARLVILILATLPGFVHISHWLLVDNALIFFVAAAIWALAEAYRGQRPIFILWAGVFSAGAFLTKGIIGPIIIGLGWVGLCLPKLREVGKQPGAFGKSFMILHAAAFCLFLAMVLSWVYALYVRGGPGLFGEWFWTNHFGRFIGRTVQLGHLHGPFYYLGALPLYLLPWLLAFLLGLKRLSGEIGNGGGKASDRVWLPLFWGVGGFLVLSLSSTKREIYLGVLLPAMAMIAAQGIQIPVRSWILRATAVLAIAYIVGLNIAEPLIDRHKSYGPAFREFSDKLENLSELKPAAWGLDETTRAGFYFYCGRIFPGIENEKDLAAVMAGKHPQFNSVVVCRKNDGELPPELAAGRIAEEARMGTRRELQLIAGDAAAAGLVRQRR